MTQLSPRQELLAIQKKIYRQNKLAISRAASAEDPSFVKYEKDYLRAVANYEAIATVEEAQRDVGESNLVLVGDYHTLNQSQRSFLRLLRMFVPRISNVAIALELVQARHQSYIDKYMKGLISDQTFLKKIGFYEHWIFDFWENFRPIFDFARYHQIPVFGIEGNVKASLKVRDEFMGKKLVEIHNQDPQRKIFALIGDLHLAPSHVPKEIKKRDGSGLIRYSVLFQNSDAIYWKLADMELEEKVNAVRLRPHEYCRMHTPPIICQQSYLNWLEHEEEAQDYADARQLFLKYLDQIASFLGIGLPKSKEDIEVFTCGDLSFLKRLKETGAFSQQEFKEIKRQILRSESYYIAKTKMVYLANVSVNHVAEEASHMMRNLCAGEEFPRAMDDAFYANVIHEALGFFGSKIINHQRKCLRPKGAAELVEYLIKSKTGKNRQLELQTALLFLEHEQKIKRGEFFHANKVRHFSTDLFLSVTHAIAYYLGEQMYYALVEGKLPKNFMRQLYCDPMEEEGEPLRIYKMILRNVRHVKLPRRV